MLLSGLDVKSFFNEMYFTNNGPTFILIIQINPYCFSVMKEVFIIQLFSLRALSSVCSGSVSTCEPKRYMSV